VLLRAESGTYGDRLHQLALTSRCEAEGSEQVVVGLRQTAANPAGMPPLWRELLQAVTGRQRVRPATMLAAAAAFDGDWVLARVAVEIARVHMAGEPLVESIDSAAQMGGLPPQALWSWMVHSLAIDRPDAIAAAAIRRGGGERGFGLGPGHRPLTERNTQHVHSAR
jgi:hypothetical protein